MVAVFQNTNLATSGWRAELSLRFARDGSRTVLAERRHIGPLVVQRPFYPEGDVCHVYLVHPPGGIVGGDRLQFNARVEDGAHAVITTPAATKFYRTLPDTRSILNQELRVGRGVIEWLPQETILFRNAHASLSTVVHLEAESRFIGWEQTCYGRPASGELFDSGEAKQAFEVWIGGIPVFLDRLHIRPASMRARWGLASSILMSTLLAYPAVESDLDAARLHEAFASTLIDRVLSCRLLNSDADTAKKNMIELWRTLRPRIVNREAVSPRIWAT